MKKSLYLVVLLAGCAHDPYAETSPQEIKKASSKARPVVGGPMPAPSFATPGEKDVMLPPPTGERQTKPLIIRG